MTGVNGMHTQFSRVAVRQNDSFVKLTPSHANDIILLCQAIVPGMGYQAHVVELSATTARYLAEAESGLP